MQELRKLRQGKFTDSEIEEEFRDIVQRIEIERQQGSFFDIFRKANLRRTIIVVGANFFLQATGQNFTSNYGALFAKSLGTINPFSVTVMLGAVNTATAFLAMVLTDKLGRR
jgi:MFS transporter, SP family, sugar:H+ symporter